MTHCLTCGQVAPPEIYQMMIEDGYDGDYFCDEECRNRKRQAEESYDQY